MSSALSKVKFYAVFTVLNLLVGATFFAFSTPRTVEAQTPPPKPIVREVKVLERQAVQGIPVRVVVPSVGIDVSVATGSYDPNTESWTLDDTQAFYADISVPVNDNNGVTLIYGHARSAVFSRILQVTDGAEATVYTDNGNVFRYRYESRQDVDPTDLSVVHSDGPPTLMLQTCSGPFDAYRTMVSFKLISVERA